MNSRVIWIVAAVSLIIVAIIWPILFPAREPPTVITHIVATQHIATDTIIAPDMLEVVETELTEEEVEVQGKEGSSTVPSAEASPDALHLVVGRIAVDQGSRMWRIRPRAQGRASWIQRRTSHVEVVLSEK